LGEDRRTGGGEPDEEGDEEEKRREEEEGDGGEHDVDEAFEEEANFVVGGGGKGEERDGAETFEVHFAVDVREEVDGNAGADAFFVALEEDWFEGLECVRIDGEDDFVDYIFAKKFGKLGNGVDGVIRFEADVGVCGRVVCGWTIGGLVICEWIICGLVKGEEAFETDTLVGSGLEILGDLAGAVAEADNHDVAKGAEFPADQSDKATGDEAEGEDEGKCEGGEEDEEGPGKIEAEGIFGKDESYGGVAGLADEVAEYDAALSGAEVFVDAEPVAGENPSQDGEAEDEGLFVGAEEEVVPKIGEREPRLVGGFEGEGDEEDIGQSEQQLGFPVLIAKHVAECVPSTIVGRGSGDGEWEMLH
jgi:hypothetical protein